MDSTPATDPSRASGRQPFSLDFPRAWGDPVCTALFRREPADFRVDEIPGFEFSGSGEHFCLRIGKEDQNTRWVAGLLAAAFDVDEREVGYCGMKDRRAVTSQWFSLPVANTPTAVSLNMPGVRILDTARHHRKLRRGMHRGNRFLIRLRQLGGNLERLEPRLTQIRDFGVPNYYGEQRFGRDGGNLREAEKCFARARPRFRGALGGLYLSAARSWLFNQVLAERVSNGSWASPLAEEGEPQGPLWGRGRNPAPAAVAELEAEVLAPWRSWCNGLEHSGLRQERRPLRLVPEEMGWHLDGDDLELTFTLGAGAFATSILRELAVLTIPARPES